MRRSNYLYETYYAECVMGGIEEHTDEGYSFEHDRAHKYNELACPDCMNGILQFNSSTGNYKCFQCGFECNTRDLDVRDSLGIFFKPKKCIDCGGPYPDCESTCYLDD